VCTESQLQSLCSLSWVERLVKDYGSSDRVLLAEGITKIQKRFGGDNVKKCLEKLDENDLNGVADMLLGYYDKMYTFSLKKYKKHKPLNINCVTSDPSENADVILNEVKNMI